MRTAAGSSRLGSKKPINLDHQIDNERPQPVNYSLWTASSLLDAAGTVGSRP